MSGIWVFKNGVARLIPDEGLVTKKKVLVYTPTNETITSYAMLEQKLRNLGWERFYYDADMIQFHREPNALDLISLPEDFRRFKSIHMYDVVVKNKSFFEVREV